MVCNKKSTLTALIVVWVTMTYGVFHSLSPASNGKGVGFQEPIQLNLYYHDTKPVLPYGIQIQPRQDHSKNVQSIYNIHEQVNFTYMSRDDYSYLFNDASNENTILEKYELYAFEGFKDYARGLKSYKEFIVGLQDKIRKDKKFRQQTANIPGFTYSFFLWKEKSGFHDFIKQEVCRIHGREAREITTQKNFLRTTQVDLLLQELSENDPEY